MLIFATIAIDVAAIAIYSAVYGVNGFKEVGKLIKGQPSFGTPLPATNGTLTKRNNIPEPGTEEWIDYVNQQRAIKGLPPVDSQAAANSWWDSVTADIDTVLERLR